MKRICATSLRRLLILGLTLGIGAAARGQPGLAHPRTFADFALRDATGKTHTRKCLGKHKVVVLFFMGTECPLANFYAPMIEQLAKTYAARGVAVYGVHSDPEMTATDAAKHAAEYRLTFPILLDPTQILARQADVAVVPQVAVLAPSGRVLYCGRIDDRYSLNGKRRDEPRMRDLEDALTAVLSGRAPAVARTRAFGCPLPDPARSEK